MPDNQNAPAGHALVYKLDLTEKVKEFIKDAEGKIQGNMDILVDLDTRQKPDGTGSIIELVVTILPESKNEEPL